VTAGQNCKIEYGGPHGCSAMGPGEFQDLDVIAYDGQVDVKIPSTLKFVTGNASPMSSMSYVFSGDG
jgi:hypothetical protein